ncbi:mitochondrial import receptor protein [Rhizophlyctis rosea]|nr:mitochondrial import receptor protein [Rhizophlyctis rosea]
MVQLTEVTVEEKETVEILAGADITDEDDDQYEDIDALDDAALSSDNDDLDADEDDDELADESLLDRIGALRDIIPPTARAKVYNGVYNTASWTWSAGRFIGSAAWVIATGALLVLLPVALELEKEAAMLQQEAQARGAQQQAQQLIGTPGAPALPAK